VRWHRKLFGHARRLIGDGELARDVTQEAWLETLRGLGWTMWLCYLGAISAFAGSLYALWQLCTTDALLSALRFGIGTVLLFQLALMLKSFMGEQLQANRVLRELRRIELRLVRS